MSYSEDIIVLMSTVHKHMSMEEQLDRKNITYRTIVKPRQISTDCGMALKISISDIQRVKEISENIENSGISFYIENEGVWQMLDIDS
ncbi:DUF3343 domain-containing protein [bacterium]|nr:DUF3343 domain-containing protein [bacterium]